MIAAIFGRQPHSNICANTKSSGGRRILRLPPLNISTTAQIMINRPLLPTVGRAPRARRKQATTQPTSAVQTQILPWPILPAASAPSCDSRHRLASCTNPQARIPPRWSSPSRPRLRHNTADDASVDIMLGEEGGQGRITLTW